MVYVYIWIALGILFVIVGLAKGSAQPCLARFGPVGGCAILVGVTLAGPITWIVCLYLSISDSIRRE